MSPFTRDGHVSDLGVELVLDGALAPDPAEAVRAHAEGCPRCAARLFEASAHQATVRLAPPRPQVAANRSWMWATPIALAAAALLAVGLRAGDAGDLRPKGSGGLVLEVYVDLGEVSRQVWTGDAVRSGDRLGFRVATPAPGELLIAGIDGTGAAWLAWPADGISERIDAGHAPSDVPGAVLLDERPGPERLIAVRCDGALGFDALADALERAASDLDPYEDLPLLLDGCDQAEVVLDKEAR